MSYEPTYTRPYEGGYKNLPSEDTVEMAEFINKRDDTLIKIEEYLASGELALSERKIAGKDLTDDITAEELKEAIGVDALETDLDNAKVAIRNQGVVLKQTQNDVKERIKKFYTNNMGEQFSADTDDGLVRDLIVGGVSIQGENPNPEFPQEIKKTIISEIKTHGKNLFDITTLAPRNTSQGGTIEFDGDVAHVSSAGQGWATCLSDLIPVKRGEQHILRFKISNWSATTDTYISLNDGDEYYGGASFRKDGYYELTFTPVGDKAQMVVVSNGANNTVTNTFTLSEVQIELGEIATPYEPYTECSVILSEPIELNGIGDVQDVIDVENGAVRRRFEEVIFDGSDDEGWTSNGTSTSGRHRFGITVKNAKPNGKISCSALMADTYLEIYYGAKNNIIAINDGQSLIQCVATDYATVDEWKAYLQSNPITVIYELADEVIEPLPVADQIALKALPTYYGGTYILSDSEVEATFDYNYPCSIENFVEYVKEQMGDTREFNYNMEQRITNEEYLSALAFVNSEYSIALTEMGV